MGAQLGFPPDLKRHCSVTSGKPDPEFERGAIHEIDLPTRNMVMNCVADCFTDEAFIQKISPNTCHNIIATYKYSYQ